LSENKAEKEEKHISNIAYNDKLMYICAKETELSSRHDIV
jgi:hypothetical protein